MSILFKEVRLRGIEGKFDVLVDGSKIESVKSQIKAEADRIVKADGRLLLPSFTDMHFHLDSVLTQGMYGYNLSGTLLEGIELWNKAKKRLTVDDIIARAERALKMIVSCGTTRLRTHADVSDPDLKTLKALLKVKEKYKGVIDIQITAFPQNGILTDPGNATLLERAVEMGADNVGIIPHYEYTREDGIRSIDFAFELAKRYKKDIDGHVDETDDENSRFLEVLAAKTIRERFQGRVAAGHVTAMHGYNGSYMQKLLLLLKRSNITIVSNPLVNVHLQGRFDGYPRRRGIARIKELLQSGVNVALGHDCIMDPWYPLGKGDMLQVLFMAVHLEQLTGIEEIKRSFDMITVNPAKALRIEKSYGIEPGKMADLVLLDARDEVEALSKLLPPLAVIKNGKVVAERNELKTALSI
ncbi:MAG: cytosine deaminase [Conexivisphaerales archaeon]